MGFNDKSGSIRITQQDDSMYMNDVMHFLNTTKAKVSTYKYAFFKSILDNLFNVQDDLSLGFDCLSKSFSIMYWNLINKYKLPQFQQGNASTMEKVLYEMTSENELINEVDFDSIKVEYQKEYLNKTKNVISINVVGALFSDLNESIYGFDKSKKKIFFSKTSYEFLCNYKSALEKLNYYAWIYWMERQLELRKQSCANIASKLDESSKRESLESFKKELVDCGDELKCFYCGKPLSFSNMHLDHFVPWSFVKNDQIWNFVFSCSHCNESKNDCLPSEEDLNRLIEKNKLILQDGHEKELRRLYESAKHNGFIEWNRK